MVRLVVVLALAFGVLLPLPAADRLPRQPSIVHTPQVAEPAPDDAPGYRLQLAAITERYTSLYYSAELRSALGEARQGLALAEKAGTPRDEAQFLKAVGYVTWLLGDTAASLEATQRLLNLANRFNDDRLRSIAHRVMGSVYRQLGDQAKDVANTEAALACAERAGDAGLRAGALNNLGVQAMLRGDFAKARAIHTEVLAYRERAGDPWDRAGSITNLADVAFAEKNYGEALALHERALRLRQEVGDQRGIVRSLRQVAGALRALGRTDEALTRLDEALARATKITGHELLRDIWQEITLTREARGEFALALEAERRAGKEREALAGERARSRMAELQARFDDSRKQDTIDRLRRERRLQEAELQAKQAELGRARLRNLFLGAGLLGGAAWLGTIVWTQRARLRAERRARDAAEQADALKTRLLGIVSHDIRGPLGAAQVLAEDLRDELPADQRDERLDVIVQETGKVMTLAQDLLTATALESGSMPLALGPTDLGELVRTALADLLPLAAAKGQRVRVDAPSGGAPLQADAGKLTQLIANLVSNAIKYSPPGSDLAVAVTAPPGRAVLTVRDAGPGFTAEDRAKMFRPFVRLSAKPTGGETSHGLGLSIVREIVRRHQGTVTVDANADGPGSTFRVELPA